MFGAEKDEYLSFSDDSDVGIEEEEEKKKSTPPPPPLSESEDEDDEVLEVPLKKTTKGKKEVNNNDRTKTLALGLGKKKVCLTFLEKNHKVIKNYIF